MSEIPLSPLEMAARARAQERSDDWLASVTPTSEPGSTIARGRNGRFALLVTESYVRALGQEPDGKQVERLLEGIADLERALWLESSGMFGAAHAHAQYEAWRLRNG